MVPPKTAVQIWTIRESDAEDFLRLCHQFDQETDLMLLGPDERTTTVGEQRRRIADLLVGSGKFGTPCERMQRAKASCWEFVDPPAFDELPGPVDDGLPPHAAVSRARPAVAMMAAALRAVRGHARRGRRVTRLLWLIMVSSRGG